MKILVTGAAGFVGKNLIAEFKNRGFTEIFEYDVDTDERLLDNFCKEAEFVIHLAGVNRPKEETEFMEGNFGFTSKILEILKKNGNKSPIIISSSTQAALDNPYGRSKKAGEDLMLEYEKETGAKVYIYRFPNIFGKWCKPNYNSAIATFCYNIANNLPIKINDRNANLRLVYIDDVVNEIINAINGKANKNDVFYSVPVEYSAELGKITDMIYSFRKSRDDLSVPDMSDGLTKKLYSTYLSYLPRDSFSYPLRMNQNEKGSFTEFLRTNDRGQVSLNISKANITKGNHWHHTKNEKFLVVSGKGVIRFRKIDESEIIEYHVSGDKLEVVDIPVGYTHNIENLGDSDMLTIMWANESYDPEKPDTFYLEV